MTSLILFLWVLQGLQMLAWWWFNKRGCKLPDRQYLLFAAGLMAGQIGGGVEALLKDAIGPVVTQSYFLITTAWGAYKRYRSMRAAAVPANSPATLEDVA